jgi:flagellar basal body rod protein FlgG
VDPQGVAAHLDPQRGVLWQGERQIGPLRLVEFDHPDRLLRVGETLFSPTTGAGQRRAGKTDLVPRMLELPAERAISGLVGLISANREFEAAQRVMAVINRSYEKLIGQGA